MKSFRTAILSALLASAWLGHSQGYISPFKYKDGNFVMKSKYEISQEETQRTSRPEVKMEFEKPNKKYARESGEIWIGGYCRYRPASYSTSNHDKNMSEAEYQREKYPSDTVIYSEGFKEKGNVPWVGNVGEGKEEQCKALLERITNYYNDGVPFQVFDSLRRVSTFFNTYYQGKRTGREYEFSRAVSIWVKRTNGPESMPIKLTASFTFVNSEDYIDIEINDKGKFTIMATCDNDDPQRRELESGKAKSWRTGDWNEITVKKDEFNNILVYANDELILTFKTPNVPVATRFSGIYMSMPYQWEKKGLQYKVGRITSISYPRLR